MSERWKMNRIGFVNFWLYDEEDFEFEDGKLLLRGQNGSGKSITTQSFIPFVLDGDRTPSRLDPFGSSDRRMEYYFLGEEGKEESTGYLFLEFWKEDSGEYRTIGIGQKAKRGKPMDFWGFVILDGRRVGYDLWLYKEVGSNKIPRDKREMKAELGEDNFFTDSPSEYKKHVNQYIFGFRKEEQYEQFIKLLVKVRAPKLSKEFKPTKVYDILNDSLQTLTDEELRPMVDAMEKMDEIQDSLEMLNRAFDDVKIIRNEYTRYNQYMLAKKAQGYLGKKQEVEKEQAILADQEQRQSEALEEQNRAVQDTERLTAEKKLKETERNALLDPELEDADRKLEKLKAEHQEAVDGEQRWEKKIEDGRERIREEEIVLKKLEEQLELRRDTLKEKRENLEEQQEILQWEHHEKAKEKIGLEEYEERDEIAEHLQIWKNQLTTGRTALSQYELISGQYEEAASRLEETKKKKAAEEQRLEMAEEQVADRIDAWITEVFHRAETSEEWHPEREVLLQAEQKARRYDTVADGVEIQGDFRADYERQRQQLTDAKNEKQYQREIQEGILKDVREQLKKVQEQQELEPERDETVEKSRVSLAQAGITAIPFYRTVEFAKDLEESACARLEAQMQMTGMLDQAIHDADVLKAIIEYEAIEIPSKFLAVEKIVRQIIEDGGKVVIWATFIHTIHSIKEYLESKGIQCQELYGAIPVEKEGTIDDGEEQILTREKIVRAFQDDNCPFKVIIANPFAVAESISLHKACHNAIYLERSFNAAHFVQSKDRIHRYGLKEGTKTNYYYILSEDSIDETIDARLAEKEHRMNEIMESMPIPLFDNASDDLGDEDIKALIKDYVRRTKKN